MTGPALKIGQTLDAMTGSILSGNFADLAALARTLDETLVQPGLNLDRDALLALQAKADRNATLLRAAQRGLQAARRRLAEIRGVAQGLTTYDASGQRAYRTQSVTPDHRA